MLLNPGSMSVIDQPPVWEEKECEGVGAAEEGYPGWDVSRGSHDQSEIVSLGDQAVDVLRFEWKILCRKEDERKEIGYALVHPSHREILIYHCERIYHSCRTQHK
jgi:hypothetical protein